VCLICEAHCLSSSLTYTAAIVSWIVELDYSRELLLPFAWLSTFFAHHVVIAPSFGSYLPVKSRTNIAGILGEKSYTVEDDGDDHSENSPAALYGYGCAE
jgi:hypothetical protein